MPCWNSKERKMVACETIRPINSPGLCTDNCTREKEDRLTSWRRKAVIYPYFKGPDRHAIMIDNGKNRSQSERAPFCLRAVIVFCGILVESLYIDLIRRLSMAVGSSAC